MKTIVFEEKEYALVKYENNKLITKDKETLDYISQSLYGDISVQTTIISNTANPSVQQYIRSVKENKSTEKK